MYIGRRFSGASGGAAYVGRRFSGASGGAAYVGRRFSGAGGDTSGVSGQKLPDRPKSWPTESVCMKKHSASILRAKLLEVMRSSGLLASLLARRLEDQLTARAVILSTTGTSTMTYG
jgi:hypothetical protein